MKTILFPAAAILAASFSTFTAVSPGYAAVEAPARTVVSYADLNLSQAQDRRILEERIEGAARSVCRAEHGYSPLMRDAQRDCAEAAVAEAASQLPFSPNAVE